MIAVIQTGGTIAGAAEAGKIHPRAGDALGEMIEASARQMNLAVMQEPLRAPSGKKLAARDSCDLGSADWLALQTQLHALAVGCSAIVVLHGTDTMAYTASALSFLAPRQPVPVILTGAQRPHTACDSDAAANIRLALSMAAGQYGNAEGDTLIAFGGKVMRGNRATKTASHRLDGFSGKEEATPETGLSLEDWQRQRPDDGPEPATGFANKVVSLNVAPGMPVSWLDSLGRDGVSGGLVLNLFGIGSAPQAAVLSEQIDRLTNSGWLCLGRSICAHGHIDWQIYGSTEVFSDSPLIDGADMTHEAACVKLMAALGSGHDAAWVAQNLAGERTNSGPEGGGK